MRGMGTTLHMTDPVGTFLAAQRAFGERVHAVAEDQWHAPTPDTEWDVADLVGHLIEEHRWAAPLLHGHDLEAAGEIVRGSRGRCRSTAASVPTSPRSGTRPPWRRRTRSPRTARWTRTVALSRGADAGARLHRAR